MKKLSDLLRIITVRRPITTEEMEPRRTPPSQAPGEPAGEVHQREPSSHAVENNPADAARKLWCRAYHF